jgi:hypothetical protein
MRNVTLIAATGIVSGSGGAGWVNSTRRGRAQKKMVMPITYDRNQPAAGGERRLERTVQKKNHNENGDGDQRRSPIAVPEVVAIGFGRCHRFERVNVPKIVVS